MSEPAGRRVGVSPCLTTLLFVWKVYVTIVIDLSNTILLLFNELCGQNTTRLRPDVELRNVKIIRQHQMCLFMSKMSEKEMV